MSIFWGKALKIMEDKGLRQVDLASATGKNKSSVSDWINHDVYPKADDAQKIADLLGVSVRYLVTGEDDRELSPREKELLEQCRVLKEEKFKVVLDLAKSLRHDWEESQKVPSSASQDSREA